jgi:hydroxyacylglutathione hydrolase
VPLSRSVSSSTPIHASQATHLDGVVKRPSGLAPAVTVRVHDSQRNIITEVVTDSTGRFEVALPPGRWTVAALSGSFGVARTAVTTSGRTTHLTLLLPEPDLSLTVHTLQIPSLGNRSYLVERDGVAVAVDVPRDVDEIEGLIETAELRLAAVLETHVHNDYLSGGLGLARRHGATYVVPEGPAVAFDAVRVSDGDALIVGGMRVGVIGTPGHTQHHVAYHVGDAPGDPAGSPAGNSEGHEPGLLLTGGSLLNGGVGRPSGLDPSHVAEAARAQYWSVRRLARLVPGSATVLPTHGSRSFCSVGATSSTTSSTLGEEMDASLAFNVDEGQFVEQMAALERTPPAYMRTMVRINAMGPSLLVQETVPRLEPAALARHLHTGEWVVDLRSPGAFASHHLPRCLNVPYDTQFAVTVGSVVPWGVPIALVGSEDDVRKARHDLGLIGFDDTSAATQPLDVLTETAGSASYPLAAFADLATDPQRLILLVLDTRSVTEWRSGHVRGAYRRPVSRVDDIAGTTRSVWVHCSTGYRASVAASMLARRGVHVVLVDDLIEHAEALGALWCDGATCGDDQCRWA